MRELDEIMLKHQRRWWKEWDRILFRKIAGSKSNG